MAGNILRSCYLYMLTIYVVRARLESEKASLYDLTDPGIHIFFNQSDFDKFVYNTDTIWLVEFYNQWCGHCIRYAPMFKDFAKDVQGWSFVVKIGTVNCASSFNTELCRTKEINAYPTLKFFKSPAGPESMGEVLEADVELKELRENLVKHLVEASDGAAWPDQFPKFQPLEDVHEIWADLPVHHTFAILVFEEAESALGSEVILDLSSHAEFVVRRMIKDSVTKYGISSFPSVYQINRDGIFQQIAPGVTSREGIVKALKELVGASFDDQKDKPGADNSDKLFFEKPQKQSPVKKVNGLHMRDLESALHYSLRQEIALRHSISGEALQALKQYIRVLAMYFPGRDPVVKFLQRLYEWVEKANVSISGDEWVAKIDSLQTSDSYLPDKVEWVCCQGSKLQYRGYPCSMWSLFHTLTVEAYHFPKDDKLFRIVLLAMRGYIKHFFGCKECSTNFYKMAVSIEKEVRRSRDSVLWLWGAHNRANKRLHGDASEDPAHLKIQFPSQKDCPECIKSVSEDGTPVWNESVVFGFLIAYYHKDNIVNDVAEVADSKTVTKSASQVGQQLDWWERQQRKTDLQKLAEIRQKKRDKSKNHISPDPSYSEYLSKYGKDFVSGGVGSGRGFVAPWGFNQIDVSLCMLLWLVSSGIVVLLYFHIMVRRKKKPCSLPF